MFWSEEIDLKGRAFLACLVPEAYVIVFVVTDPGRAFPTEVFLVRM